MSKGSRNDNLFRHEENKPLLDRRIVWKLPWNRKHMSEYDHYHSLSLSVSVSLSLSPLCNLALPGDEWAYLYIGLEAAFPSPRTAYLACWWLPKRVTNAYLSNCVSAGNSHITFPAPVFLITYQLNIPLSVALFGDTYVHTHTHKGVQRKNKQQQSYWTK